MIDTNKPAVKKLRERYSIHPLIFQRSAERATTLGHLFDVLESFPNKYPVVWDQNNSCWVSTDDMAQRENMKS